MLSRPALHHLYHIHWSLESRLTRKKSVFITSKILELLFNTLAVDEKYAVLNRDNLTIPIKMKLSQKQKIFAQFFAAFLKCRRNFEYFEKNYEPHKCCISVITETENVVRYMSKKSRFRVSFDKRHGKHGQALCIFTSQHLYLIHWSLPSQLSWKTSLLLARHILGLLVNTLAADEMYPGLNRDNLMIPIQMQLSQKQRTFPKFLLHVWNLDVILSILKQKDDPHWFFNLQITDSEDVFR